MAKCESFVWPTSDYLFRQELNRLQNLQCHFALNHGKSQRDVDHGKKNKHSKQDDRPYIGRGILTDVPEPNKHTHHNADQNDKCNGLAFPYAVNFV